MKRKHIIVTIMICIAAFLCSCSGAHKNDYLVVATIAKVVSLDNAVVTDATSLETIGCFIEGLFMLDENQEVVGGMAESFEVLEDGLIYIFHLRDANWSNGTPVTAQDFVYAWRRMLEKNAPYASLLAETAHIKNGKQILYEGADITTFGVSATDPKTLKVELESPVPFFNTLVSFPAFYPMNEEFEKSLEAGTYGTSPETVLCNGPFELESYIPGTTVVNLKKNTKYWNCDHIALKGIKFQTVTSVDVGLEAYKGGFVDVVNLKGAYIEETMKNPALAPQVQKKYEGRLAYLSFNVSDKESPVANLNIRRAISYAINRESICDNVLHHAAEEVLHPVCRKLAFDENGKDFAEPLDEYKDLVGFNPKKAQECLDAGLKEINKDSIELTLMCDNSENGLNVAQMLKGMLEKNLPKLTIKINALPFAERQTLGREGKFEIQTSNWGPDYSDPLTFLEIFMSKNGMNFGKWSNEEYDAMIREATGKYANDASKRWEILKKAERILMEDVAMAPLYTEDKVRLVRESVSNLQSAVAGVSTYHTVGKEAAEN